jgi:ABC-type polysaccharide/polyol phosphate export permease
MGFRIQFWSFAAMLPWQFFANSLSEASVSLVGKANLISKVYFPRLVIPAGAVITGFVDFAISAALLGFLMPGFASGFAISLAIIVPASTKPDQLNHTALDAVSCCHFRRNPGQTLHAKTQR